MTQGDLSESSRQLRRAAPFDSIDVFGAKLTPRTIDELVSSVAKLVDTRVQGVIAAQNMHGLYVMEREAAFRELHRSDDTMVYVDGMPLLAMAWAAGFPVSIKHRVTMLEWIWPLLDRATKGDWRVFFVGGPEEMCEKLRMIMAARRPALAFECASGYFDRALSSEDNQKLLKRLDEFAPDLVLVGMGMGRQEKWILENRASLSPASICIVGGCFEFVTGQSPTPPRWSGALGLEWLFRLASQPKRFWYRYLIEPFFVLSYLVRFALTERSTGGRPHDRSARR